ncbi:unnamed protein product [Phytophthora lilii]|uniref:Unnamed protein product n=1 Tax=Phytophthora lilii TaxID=2077276 RepID=A0A9W6TRZ8_9STRA|nr:unnamed protein product [Phytophthora lilii]
MNDVVVADTSCLRIFTRRCDAEDRSPMLKFPLSPGCFHPTTSQRQEYADIVRERVDALLAKEQQLSFLHPTEWKQVQMKKNRELLFYKRVRRGRALQELASEEEFPEPTSGRERIFDDGLSWTSGRLDGGHDVRHDGCIAIGLDDGLLVQEPSSGLCLAGKC